jgi:hypothetical protein
LFAQVAASETARRHGFLALRVVPPSRWMDFAYKAFGFPREGSDRRAAARLARFSHSNMQP